MEAISTHTTVDNNDSYVVLGQISKSNNSSVYLVRSGNNFFALKVALSASQDMKMFIGKEVESIEALGEYGGIKIVDYRYQDELLNKNEFPWLLLDYIPGINLFDLIQSLRGSGTRPAYELKLDLKYKIIYEIAKRLCDIHKLGYVHRDIKPGNIFIDPDFRPHIGDFGDLTDQTKYQFTQRMHGTLNFIPPEGFPNDTMHYPVSTKFDVYSFGATLLQIITYEWPHSDLRVKDSLNFLSLMRQRIVNKDTQLDVRFEEDGPLRSQLLPEDYELYELYKKCCSYYPDDRPTMDEVLSAIIDSARNVMDPNDFKSFIKWTNKLKTDLDSQEEDEDDSCEEEEEEDLDEYDEDENEDEDNSYFGTTKNIKKALKQGFHNCSKSPALILAANSLNIDPDAYSPDNYSVVQTLSAQSSLLPSFRPDCDHDFSYSESLEYYTQ